MISTSGVTLDRRQHLAGTPFALAFGLALVTSSASGVAEPAFPWMTTSVTQEFSNASSLGHVLAEDQTSSGLPQRGGSQTSGLATTVAQRIAEIRALTGLTIDQVGRLFGVSRRSVHNWINGNAMAPQHEERAGTILSIVATLPGSSPAERRAALLDSSHGTSLFHQLVASRKDGVRLQAAGISARERIRL